MQEDHVGRFHDSLTRCLAKPDFLLKFYERFVQTSPEVAEKFKNTDLKHQEKMLRGSLYMLIAAALGESGGRQHLETIARQHSRHDRDIRPELYDVWLDALVETAREFDPRFGPAEEAAWRGFLAPGIAFMKSRY